MEAHEVMEQAHKSSEGEHHGDRFRTFVQIWVVALALFLAIASLGGDNSGKEMINNNIERSDAYAFYQAKNIRETQTQLAADNLARQIPSLPEDQRADALKQLDSYKATIARYESEPDKDNPADFMKGQGKKEILQQALFYEETRDQAMRRDPNFDYSKTLFTVAILLAGMAGLAKSRPILGISVLLAVVAFTLMLNGFLLFANLPIG